MLARRLARILSTSSRPARGGSAHGGVDHERALADVSGQLGVDLASARVRVGLTRGHLLEVVVSVPLDVAGDDEQLEEAAERYVERVVGEGWFDAWIAGVGVTRSARARGLMVLAEGRGSAATYPLAETARLIERGVCGLEQGLPESLLVGRRRADWLALELSPGPGDGLQAERTFASTRYPEALKAALEGLPFHTARFTRGDELLVWLAWRAPRDAGERLALRDEHERRLEELAGTERLCVIGSGFGPAYDYLDLVVGREPRPLLALCAALGWELASSEREVEERGEAEAELGFYDDDLRSHGLSLSRRAG